MNMQDIATFIGTLGFPIFACGAMGWYIYKINEKMRETIDKNTEAINNMINLFKEES